MQCLIDGDVLAYEVGFAAETAYKGSHPDGDGIPHWNTVEDMLEKRIQYIEEQCEADEPSIMFFTGKENFRNAIAKRTPYKQRAGVKPTHWLGIRLYLQSSYHFRLMEGFEADDLMSIEQTSRLYKRDTIICTRDKDHKQLFGWNYGWEIGKQASFGPFNISGYGMLSLSENRKKIEGYGPKFFLSQCLTGDVVDSVPGLPKCGPVAAFECLSETSCYKDGLSAVISMYETVFRDRWKEELTEQGQLLWLTRQLNSDGSPELWSLEDDFTEKIERSCYL